MAGVKRSTRIINWIEGNGDFCGLRVPEGKDVGKPIKLRKWQKREIRKIFDNPHKTRRALISFGRKNGKTALAAMLLLVFLVGPEAVMNTQMYSAAQSRDQAALLYNLASKMVLMCPDLEGVVGLRDSSKQLYCTELGTIYRALSADATTAYGMSPIFAVHDELGQVRGPTSKLYEAVETGMSAHEAPLSLVISTQAPTDADLLSVLIDDALEGNDPRTVVSLYTVPEDADPFDIENVKLANPAFGDFQNAEEVIDQLQSAQRMPTREAEYRNLILNQRVEASAPYVTRTVWKENGGDFEGWGWAYAGLDLSETNDLTAFVLASPDEDNIIRVKPTFWLPEEGLAERSRRDRVPYDVWHEQGYLNVTPGNAIQYEWVAKEIVKAFGMMQLRKVAFDRWNMRHLRPWLIKAGLTESFIDAHFVDFGQGYQSMSPALRTMETYLLESQFRHAMHPVLTMCASNAVVKSDEAGNRKLDKKRSTGRIDGMVALTMATSLVEEALEDKIFGLDDEDGIFEELNLS